MVIPTNHASDAQAVRGRATASADDTNPTVSIFTDGACSNNGQSNPQGGWGAVLMSKQGQRLKIAGKLQGDATPTQ